MTKIWYYRCHFRCPMGLRTLTWQVKPALEQAAKSRSTTSKSKHMTNRCRRRIDSWRNRNAKQPSSLLTRTFNRQRFVNKRLSTFDCWTKPDELVACLLAEKALWNTFTWRCGCWSFRNPQSSTLVRALLVVKSTNTWWTVYLTCASILLVVGLTRFHLLYSGNLPI